MTLPNSEAGGGEPVLQREAHKALSGRVPVILAIVLALLSGMLVGYGIRAFTVEEWTGPRSRELRCPMYLWRRPPLEPSIGSGPARLRFMQGGERKLGAVRAGDADEHADARAGEDKASPTRPGGTPRSPAAAY